MSSASHEVYLAQAGLIERTLTSVCRRHSLYGADAEDFSSTARLHLIENDCEVIRRFQERSSMGSYLIVVITRQFQDWRNARWGKWRPSAEAKRLGDVAVRFETMTGRDGLSFDEAYELLRTHHRITESMAQLESIAERLPRRYRKTVVQGEVMNTIPAPTGSAEDEFEAQEAAAAAQRASTALALAMRQLPVQARLILRMRFQDNCQVADIARALGLEAKPLYRHLEKLLGTLRRTLEGQGLTSADLLTAWSNQGFDRIEGGKSWGEVRPLDRSGHAPALTGGHRD